MVTPVEISRRTFVKAGVVGVVGVTATQVMASGAEAVTLGKVQIPKIKVNKPVYSGTSKAVLNRGGFGHWLGSAKPGADGHCVLFAHRTSAGGPLRRANLLAVGDMIVANGVTYTVKGTQIVGRTEVRKSLNYGTSGRRLSLITCTKPNGTPTSTKFRLIIRATA